MPLNDILSARILSVYSNQILKANTYTYEWRTVHGKTKSFQRRYKISSGTDEPKSGVPALGTRNSQNSAALSDRLTHGTNINGIFYDIKGERIHLTKEQLAEAKQQYSQQSISPASKGPEYKRDIDKKANERKNAIMDHITKKDPLYLEEAKKLKDTHDKSQRDEEGRKRSLSLALEHIVSTKDALSIHLDLKRIRSNIKDDIDPIFTITTTGKDGKDITVKRPLDNLIDSFDKLSSTPGSKVHIKKIDMDDLDEYSLNDFEMKNHTIDPKTHQKIYDKVNKKLSKENESRSE